MVVSNLTMTVENVNSINENIVLKNIAEMYWSLVNILYLFYRILYLPHHLSNMFCIQSSLKIWTVYFERFQNQTQIVCIPLSQLDFC
jgi:pantothenate kinase